MIRRTVFLSILLAFGATTAMTAPAPERKNQSIYDQEYKKAELPGPGDQLAHPKDENLLYYITNRLRMWGRKENVGKHPGLYVSKDGGKTWRILCLNFEFRKLFVHPNTGHLFAIINYDWLATNDKDGTLEHCYANKIIQSADGRKWKDITGGHGYVADLIDIFSDPDNPGRVCVVASVLRPYVLQAKDDRYSEWNWLRVDRPEGQRLTRNRPAAKK